MANLRDIKRRITSVTSTQKITKAMKMVAAAKLRRAQEAIIQSRPYALQMREVVNHMASRAELDGHPLLRANSCKTGKVSFLVISSDRGLCGGFNSSIVNAAMVNIQKDLSDKDVDLTVVGRKGIELLKRRTDAIAHTYTNVFDGDVYEEASKIIDHVSEIFSNGETEAVYCLYNEFKSAIQQNVTLERMLPFEPTPTEGRFAHTDYEYEPSQPEVFDALLARHMKIQMHRILNESAASEHGARMTAMESATTNAGEMIDRLTLQYNRARQNAITTELIEVISGAEAL
jgi:F-type H+-transporting ATPase subunit gamma